LLLVVAKDQWLIQNGPGTSEFFTDPVNVGRFDRVAMHLLVRSLTPGTIAANVTLTMVPQTANVVSSGFVTELPAISVTGASGTPVAQVTDISGEVLRFRFQLVVASDMDLKTALFDAHVLLDKR
jgi:hypothetical protein